MNVITLAVRNCYIIALSGVVTLLDRTHGKLVAKLEDISRNN